MGLQPSSDKDRDRPRSKILQHISYPLSSLGKLLRSIEDVGTDAQQSLPRVHRYALLGEPGGCSFRLRRADNKKGPALLLSAKRHNPLLRQACSQSRLLRQRIRSQSLNAHGQSEFKPCTGLIERQHGRGGFEPAVRSPRELWILRARKGEWAGRGKPSGIEGPQALEMAGMDIEPCGSRPAAQVFVAAADGEIDIQSFDIDGKSACRMIKVNQYANSLLLSHADDRAGAGQELACVEEHQRYNKEIRTGMERISKVVRPVEWPLPRPHPINADPAAMGIGLEDKIDRAKFASRRNDAERSGIAIQDCSETLSGARFGNNTLRSRRADEARDARPEERHLGKPLPPFLAKSAIPVRKPFGNSGCHAVKRAPERIIGKINPLAALLQHA